MNQVLSHFHLSSAICDNDTPPITSVFFSATQVGPIPHAPVGHIHQDHILPDRGPTRDRPAHHDPADHIPAPRPDHPTPVDHAPEVVILEDDHGPS